MAGIINIKHSSKEGRMSQAIIEEKDGKYLITIHNIKNTFVVDQIVTPGGKIIDISEKNRDKENQSRKEAYRKIFCGKD